MRWLALALLIVLLGAAGSARADADAEAWELLQRGTALYREGDYAGAREVLGRARALVPNRVPAIDRWMGLADARLGHCADALVELERFLASSPADPDALAEVNAARDGCKQALETLGLLRVDSAPPGAEVRLDNADPKTPALGVTPFQTEHAPLGDHLVCARLAGHQPASRIVTIAAGTTAQVKLDLLAIAATPIAVAPARQPRPLWKRAWFWPVVAAGAAVVIATAVAVGVVENGSPPPPTYPTLTFK